MHKLTHFQTLKDNQFSLRHSSCIHNLQNKLYSFRINNEIPNYKIFLCATPEHLSSHKGFSGFHFIHFIQIYVLTFCFFPCCNGLSGFRVNTIFSYFTPIAFCLYLIYVFGKYLLQSVSDTMSKSDRVVYALTLLLPPSCFNLFVICSI
jgi:hypothetical protein